MSSVVRWFTRSNYSHAAVEIRPGVVIESWQGRGVQEVKLRDRKTIDEYEVEITEDQMFRIEAFLRSHLGDRYDYLGIVGFVIRMPLGSKDRWFCSELVFAAFQFAGIDLLLRVNATAVSPALLSMSPLLVNVKSDCVSK